MRIVLAFALCLFYALPAVAQCTVVPLGVTEAEFLRRYKARMEPTGAGPLAFMQTLAGGKRLYSHHPQRRTYRNVHTLLIDAPDDMVREARLILDDDAPAALAERIRIGAAFVLTLVPGTTESAAEAAVAKATAETARSRRPTTERVGEATVHVTHFDGALMIAVGRLRC